MTPSGVVVPVVGRDGEGTRFRELGPHHLELLALLVDQSPLLRDESREVGQGRVLRAGRRGREQGGAQGRGGEREARHQQPPGGPLRPT